MPKQHFRFVYLTGLQTSQVIHHNNKFTFSPENVLNIFSFFCIITTEMEDYFKSVTLLLLNYFLEKIEL